MLRSRSRSVQGRFEQADFDFVASVLAERGTRQHIYELWSDHDGCRELMDLPEVFRGILETPRALGISAEFYFYVMVRHVLMKAELRDHGLSDYVSGLMIRRISQAQCGWLDDPCGRLTHAAQFLALIHSARGDMKTRLKLTAGEQFLVLTGLYPSSLKQAGNATEHGAIGFYEAFATRAFRDAAGLRSPFSAETKRTYGCVASCVPELRCALNQLAEELMFLGE